MQIATLAEFIVHCSVCYLILTMIFGELTVLASVISILFSFLITGSCTFFYFIKTGLANAQFFDPEFYPERDYSYIPPATPMVTSKPMTTHEILEGLKYL